MCEKIGRRSRSHCLVKFLTRQSASPSHQQGSLLFANGKQYILLSPKHNSGVEILRFLNQLRGPFGAHPGEKVEQHPQQGSEHCRWCSQEQKALRLLQDQQFSFRHSQSAFSIAQRDEKLRHTHNRTAAQPHCTHTHSHSATQPHCRTRTHTDIQTYIHTYRHTYIHTYTRPIVRRSTKRKKSIEIAATPVR